MGEPPTPAGTPLAVLGVYLASFNLTTVISSVECGAAAGAAAWARLAARSMGRRVIVFSFATKTSGGGGRTVTFPRAKSQFPVHFDRAGTPPSRARLCGK